MNLSDPMPSIPSLTDTDFEALERAGGRQLPHHCRVYIQDEIDWFFRSLTGFRYQDVRQELKKIRKPIQAASETVRKLQEGGSDELFDVTASQIAIRHTILQRVPKADWTPLLNELDKLLETIQATQDNWYASFGAGGRPSVLTPFVNGLADVFSYLGGETTANYQPIKEHIDSPFCRFVLAAAKHLPSEVQGASVPDLVRRCVQERRKNR